MSDIEHWTIWLMPDSEWPFCVERGISERQIAGVERIEVVRADLYRGAVEAALDKAEAETRRLLDEDDAPMVRKADLDALARVRRLLGGQ